MTTKFLIKLLAIIATLAERDARKAAEANAKFKKKQAAKAKVLDEAANRLRSKAARLAGESTRCRVGSTMGDSDCQQRELSARCLAAGARSVVTTTPQS